MYSSFASPPARQLFSVPYDFILYMIENPLSPEALKNLYQTCKFFFTKNQILFLANPANDYFYDATMQKSRKRVQPNSATKLWLEGDVYIDESPWNHSNKFYRITPKSLLIEACVLSISEFELLVAENTVEKFKLRYSSIKRAACDIILQNLPNVTEFFYWNEEEVWFLETLENLNLLQRTPKLKAFEVCISEVSEDFSSPLFVQFMLQNGDQQSNFKFFFYGYNPTIFCQIARMELITGFFRWKSSNRNVFKVNFEGEKNPVEVRFS